MNISTPPSRTPAQVSLDKIQDLADLGLQQIAAGIEYFNQGYDELWSGSDEDVIGRFNEMGFATAMALLERHQSLGQLLNPILDERDASRQNAGLPPLSPHRMPLVPGRNLKVDPDTQTFSIEPNPEETP